MSEKDKEKISDEDIKKLLRYASPRTCGKLAKLLVSEELNEK